MESADPVAAFLRAEAVCAVKKKLPKISEKVLTAQSRQLQADGVLAREATASIPPQVTYSLSPAGEKLVPLMESLCDWGSALFGIEPNLPRRREPRLAARGARLRRRPLQDR
jgi:DNA-binding HxlR family transcriptional regulator